MAGLPASGKSVLARRLQGVLQAVLLDKDQVRACLFEGYVTYTRDQDDLCVDVLYDVAEFHLRQRPETPIILDGRTYSRTYQVNALKQAARRMDVPLRIIECVCSPETARLRLQQDAGVHVAQDRDYALYQRSRSSAEPIEEPRQVVATDCCTLDECVNQALSYLQDR
jgi:predicted kinase